MLHAENARFFNCFYCFWSLGDNDFNIQRDISVRTCISDSLPFDKKTTLKIFFYKWRTVNKIGNKS